MLGRKASGRRHAFDIGQQQTTRGNGKQLVEFQHSEPRQRKAGQSFRNLSGERNTQRGKSEQRGDEDRQGHDRKPDRLARQQPFAGQQQRD
jgi:hypothetical protein